MFKNKERSNYLGRFFYLKVVSNKAFLSVHPITETYRKFVRMEKKYSKRNPLNQNNFTQSNKS